jgi:hypothetical protein
MSPFVNPAGLDPELIKAAIAALRPDPELIKAANAALRPDPELIEAAMAATRPNLALIKAALAATRPTVDLLDSLGVSVASLRHLTRAAHEKVGGTDDELLDEFGSILADDDETSTESVIDWLILLSPISQRRAMLLGISALWAVVDAVDAVAGVTQPAHIDKVIVALLAVAAFLSEWIELHSPDGD